MIIPTVVLFKDNSRFTYKVFASFTAIAGDVATKNADNVAIDTFLFIPCDSFLLVL